MAECGDFIGYLYNFVLRDAIYFTKKGVLPCSVKQMIVNAFLHATARCVDPLVFCGS